MFEHRVVQVYLVLDHLRPKIDAKLCNHISRSDVLDTRVKRGAELSTDRTDLVNPNV